MFERLEDKVVWITGGGTGIGKALALEFASRDCDVAVSGRREHKLQEAIDEIEQAGAVGLAVPCDVTDEEQLDEAVQQIVDQFGRLDVAVANAGYSANGRIENLSADEWRHQMDVNVVGLAQTARYALPELEKTDGRVVLMGSVAGTVGLPDSGAYCASKSAVRSIGQTLSIELADSSVSCTTIQPGFVDSEIHKVDSHGQRHEDWKDPRPQKLMWPADKAARVMADAIAKRKREFTFTGHGRVTSFVGQHFPGLLNFVMRQLDDSGWT
jgi:NAD(P)-dependent dehydrogenase (short-subunit alcohol dehydrogenase family)